MYGDDIILEAFDEESLSQYYEPVKENNEFKYNTPVKNVTMTKAKRNKMEKLIYDVFDALDPTKENTLKYKKMFKGMSDAQFNLFFKNFFNNDQSYLILDIVDYERTLTMDNIEEAANILGVPLFEYVCMPFIDNNTENPIMTKFKVPVGYIPIKRVQQMVRKKNTASVEISERSALTGQVTGKDKNARESDSENFALLTLDVDAPLREFLGPRADDMVMKNEMYSQATRKGYVSLDELPNELENKVTLQSLDVYLIGMGIKSDLVTNGLIVKKTLR